MVCPRNVQEAEIKALVDEPLLGEVTKLDGMLAEYKDNPAFLVKLQAGNLRVSFVHR